MPPEPVIGREFLTVHLAPELVPHFSGALELEFEDGPLVSVFIRSKIFLPRIGAKKPDKSRRIRDFNSSLDGRYDVGHRRVVFEPVIALFVGGQRLGEQTGILGLGSAGPGRCRG